MKKKIIAACAMAALTISGCHFDTQNNHNSGGQKRMQDPTEDVTYHGPTKDIKKHSALKASNGSFGYIHYTRKPGAENALSPNHLPKTDYKAMADIITRLELTLSDIYDAGTLVTDQYVLIGYKTDNRNKDEAASQVKLTALSVVPNYYKVFVSDDVNTASELANFKDMPSGTQNVHQWIEHMINQMKASPQGHITKNKNNPLDQGMDESERKTEGNQKRNDHIANQK